MTITISIYSLIYDIKSAIFLLFFFFLNENAKQHKIENILSIMKCISEVIIESGGFITNALEANCIKISSDIKGTIEGNKDAYAFVNVAKSVAAFDFSDATDFEQIGAYTFYNCKSVKSFDLTPCKKLKSIGICAFAYCSSAVSITLPDQSPLSILPGGCFYYCNSLESFLVPSSIKEMERDNPDNWGVFSHCISLINVTFPANSQCTSIGNKVFADSSIVYIQLPPKITTISGLSFRSTAYLERIELAEDSSSPFYAKDGLLIRKLSQSLVFYPNKNKYIQDGNATIPEYIKSIDPYAVCGLACQYLDIPDTVTNLDARALSFTSIRNVIIPSTITSLPINLFEWSYNLKNITFNNKFQEIPKGIFYRCIELETFNIPIGVTTISDYAFDGCSKLVYVYVPNTVTIFGIGPFINCNPSLRLEFQNNSDLSFDNGFLFDNSGNTIILYLGNDKEIQIKDSVTKINSGAFQNREIEKVTFANGNQINEIGDSAFSQCKYLKNINLPSGIKTISKALFSQSTALESITIPIAIESIGVQAFYLCTSLNNIIFECENLTIIYNQSFEGCSQLQSIQLPNSVIAIYSKAFKDCVALTSFNLSTDLEIIGEYAFQNSRIKNIQYSESITIENLSSYCFANMDYLETFTIPNSV